MLELGVPIPSRQVDPGVANSANIAQVLGATMHYAAKDEPALFGYKAVSGEAGEAANGRYLANAKPLSIGYALGAVIDKSSFEALGLVERQEALMQVAVVDGPVSGSLAQAQPAFDAQELDVTITPKSGKITVEDGRVVTTAANQKLELSFEGLGQSETYLVIEGLDYAWGEVTSAAVNVSFTRADGREPEASFAIYAPSHQYCTGQKDFLAGAGYTKKPVTKATLTFSRAGSYSMDAIRVYALPMASFSERVEKLSQDMLENIDFHMSKRTAATNLITAAIDVDGADKLLVVTLPYSSGWTAYVDGQKTPIVCANTAFMGIGLTPGHHDIRLEYQTPGLMLGWISTALGSAALIAWAVWNRVKKPAAPAARRGAHFA